MLGAAVADDVMGLIVLTVVVRVVTEGTVSIVGVAAHPARRGRRSSSSAVDRSGCARATALRVDRALSRSAGTLVALALAFTLAFAELADVAEPRRRSSARSSPALRWAGPARRTASGASSRRSGTCSSRCSSCHRHRRRHQAFGRLTVLGDAAASSSSSPSSGSSSPRSGPPAPATTGCSSGSACSRGARSG